MTLFAGIFSRHEHQPITDSVCDELRRLISRDQADEVREFKDPRCFLVKVDIGAFADPAFRIDEDGSVSLLAGEPILALGDNVRVQTRSKDLDLLHESWKRGDWNPLKLARGVFSAVHYQPQTGNLLLISDKLCIRPLYYWADEQFVIFATALRVLESLDVIPKVMDLRGVTEMCGLGYPLGCRTPYAGISLLNAAEIVEVEEKSITRHRYWSWNEIGPSSRSEDELLTDLHASFVRAVSLRNGNDKTTVAYLSGGLDSRCVVSALLDLNVRVHTFNFALPATQDYVFGNDFAAAAGTIHEAIPKEHGDLTPDYSTLMAHAWGSSSHRDDQPAERLSLAWSGEGGSVALGHVHLSSEIAGLMRSGHTEVAIEMFLWQEQASVTSRLLQPEAGSHLNQVLHDGIHEEVNNLHCVDPARSFYLFLMLNDQRRKLAAHFENIDQHRLELQLPFFDSEFLAQVVSLPIDTCLRHEFYLKWIKLFPKVATSVPWQSYPGHAPCPLPIKQKAAYQWDDAHQNEQASALKAKLLEQAEQMLRASDFPKGILKKQYLRIATLIYRFGLRDYSYVIQAAWKYCTYWKLSGGKHALPSRIGSDASLKNGPRASRFNSDTTAEVKRRHVIPSNPRSVLNGKD